MVDSTTELTAKQVENDIAWFNDNDPELILTQTGEDRTEDYKYKFDSKSPNKLIHFSFYGPMNSTKSFVSEDYTNVYDYR